MKKPYIKPETIVVALNVRDNVLLDSSKFNPPDQSMSADDSFNSRETIKSPGVWEEW